MLRKILISLGSFITIVSASSSAHAYCNLNGDSFLAMQSNDTNAVFFNIRQKGIRLQGEAKFRTTYGVFSGYLLAEGRLQLTVRWNDGISGVYDGWVTSDGRVLSASTHERGNPSNSANWSLVSNNGRLQCES